MPFAVRGAETLSLAAYNCCGLDTTFGTRGTVAVQSGSGTTGNDVLYDNRGDGDITNDRLLVAGSTVEAGVRRPFVAALTLARAALESASQACRAAEHAAAEASEEQA